MKSNLFHKENATKVFKTAIFMALLIATYFFANNAVREYYEGRSTFSVTTRPLTMEDMPTITVCFQASKSVDFERSLKFRAYIPFTESVLSLEYGNNEVEGQHIYLRRLLVYPAFEGHCVSISLNFQAEFYSKVVAFQSFRDEYFMLSFIKMYFDHDNQANPVHNIIPLLYLTSEQNSYGAVINHWYDGNVDPFRLESGKLHFLRIPKTRIYEYLEGTCSHKSFFECVSSKLPDNRICHENGTPCAPYSLPGKEPLIDFHMCQRKQSLECYEDFSKLSWPDCKMQKSCFVKEYSLKEEVVSQVDVFNTSASEQIWGINTKAMNEMLQERNSSFLFTLNYDHWDWQRGDRATKLKVEIHKEYLVWSASTMIGNVGGMMGMTIGFSFFGYIGYVLNFLPQVRRKLQTIIMLDTTE